MSKTIKGQKAENGGKVKVREEEKQEKSTPLEFSNGVAKCTYCQHENKHYINLPELNQDI